MSKIKLILVDDHKMIREGLKTFLVEDPELEIIDEAGNGVECLEILESNKPDVVLTDLNMPQMDGLGLTQEICSKYPEIKVIALTMMGENQHIKQVLAAGAMGYLLKDCGEQELISAIKTVHNGGTYYSPKVTSIILNSIRKVKSTDDRLASKMELTEREKEVLHLILKEYSNKEIADELFISVRTVDAHKRNLLDKTGSKNLAGLVLFAVDNQLFKDI